jgi:hypothetical protein
MFIHITAGFGDNGFNGYWTLEITVLKPLKIYPDVEICQIYYNTVIGEENFYKNGKYQNNNEVQASQMYKDFESQQHLDENTMNSLVKCGFSIEEVKKLTVKEFLDLQNKINKPGQYIHPSHIPNSVFSPYNR